MTERLVAMNEARKSYGGKAVIAINSFALSAGDVREVVGANGSGKSTFLKLLCGITPPTRGRVWRKSGIRLGYLPQAGGLFEELTLRQNAELISAMIGCEGTLGANGELVERFGLGGALDHPAGQLSEGTKRLAAFLSIWAADPDVVVADEPLAGLDAANALALQDLLAGPMPDHRALLFSTHSVLTGHDLVRIADGGLVT